MFGLLYKAIISAKIAMIDRIRLDDPCFELKRDIRRATIPIKMNI